MAFGSRLPDLRVAPPGPASRALSERLAAVESRNVTLLGEAWPVFWEEAAGANVRDADGNVFVDLTGAFGVALLGHAHPEVVADVREQAGRLVTGMGDVHPPAAKVGLLEDLARLAPWDDAVAVLASTGSEAIEIALKTACLSADRPGILAFDGGYHGLTVGSLATTAREDFRRPFRPRLYPGVAFAPFPGAGPDADPAVGEALEVVGALLERGAPNGDAIGAVIVEPVQGRGGARVPATGFLSGLSSLTEAAGVLLVADEVLTGMGRCGHLLASGPLGLRPDLICLGKALGGGMPVSACLGPRSVMEAWPPTTGEALHTSTFLGHPPSCAAARAALRVTQRDDVPSRAAELGSRLLAGLREALSGHPAVRDVRGSGLLLGVEIEASGARVAAAALALGLLVLPAGDVGNVIELTPPVCLTEEQARFAVEALSAAIAAAA